MATNIHLKIDGIDGESLDAAHSKEIDVQSFKWGGTNKGTSAVGSGSGAGRAEVQDLTVTKYVDKATANLFKACMKGTHIKEIVLTAGRAGGDVVEYAKITLNQCLISSVQFLGADDSDRIQETVSINFASCKLDYTPQKADGSKDAVVSAQWNIAKNAES
jgi:type VI secretion system secreted protein Hcp